MVERGREVSTGRWRSSISWASSADNEGDGGDGDDYGDDGDAGENGDVGDDYGDVCDGSDGGVDDDEGIFYPFDRVDRIKIFVSSLFCLFVDFPLIGSPHTFMPI